MLIAWLEGLGIGTYVRFLVDEWWLFVDGPPSLLRSFGAIFKIRMSKGIMQVELRNFNRIGETPLQVSQRG